MLPTYYYEAELTFFFSHIAHRTDTWRPTALYTALKDEAVISN